MFSLDEKTIRGSFINASRKEVSDLTLPDGVEQIDFDRLDYWGWRDRRIARRAYIVVPVDGAPVSVMLKQAEASPRTRAQCSWCQDIHLPNDVYLYSARRAGAAGRKGDAVGSLVCADFECSANVRKLPPMAYLGFDAEAARENRILVLRERAASFVSAVLREG